MRGSKFDRLDRLESRARALLDMEAFVTVVFSDRTKRSMRLGDVIGLLQDGTGPRVVAVRGGDDLPGQGELLRLIRGIVEEAIY